MKILYHHRVRSKDGQYVHIEELTQAVEAAGHQIIMCGPRIVQTGEFGADAGAVAWMKAHVPRSVYELVELAYGLYDFVLLYLTARRHRPDAVYERYNLYTFAGSWVRRLCRIPLLLEVNAPIFEERRDNSGGIGVPWVAKKIENAVWRSADRVLPVTRVLADLLVRDGVSESSIRVIANGVNPARFPGSDKRYDAKARMGLEGKTVLGFVGFMRAWHGLDMIVDLVSSEAHPDLHLLMVGDGPARERIEDRFAGAGASDRITFTGVVAREWLADYLAAVDIALQPAVVPYASPLKLFEYMQMGCAIVAPDRANIREVLTHQTNALLFEPSNLDAFRSMVVRLIDDPDLRRRLGQAAERAIVDQGLLWSENARRMIREVEALSARSFDAQTAK